MDAAADPLLKLLDRFQHEGVKYILVGGHAVRLNGFLRSTEDIDILLPASVENGRRVIKALNFLPSAAADKPRKLIPTSANACVILAPCPGRSACRRGRCN